MRERLKGLALLYLRPHFPIPRRRRFVRVRKHRRPLRRLSNHHLCQMVRLCKIA